MSNLQKGDMRLVVNRMPESYKDCCYYSCGFCDYKKYDYYGRSQCSCIGGGDCCHFIALADTDFARALAMSIAILTQEYGITDDGITDLYNEVEE